MIRIVGKDGTRGTLDREQHAWVVKVYGKPSQTYEFADTGDVAIWLGDHGFTFDSSPFRTVPPTSPAPPAGRPGPILSPAGEAGDPPPDAAPPGEGPGASQQAADGAASLGPMRSKKNQEAGAFLRSLRKCLGLSRQELARRARVNPATVWYYEVGEGPEQGTTVRDTVNRLALALVRAGAHRAYVDQWIAMAGFAPVCALDAYLGKFMLASAHPQLRRAVALAYVYGDLDAVRKAIWEYRGGEALASAFVSREVAATV